MLVALLLALLAVPFIELYVIVLVARATSVPLALGVLIAVSAVGAVLVKREGRRAWQALRAALSSGRPPGGELTDGALVVLGGALMLTPGFVTDAVGLLFVLAPTRALARRLLLRWGARRMLRRARRRTHDAGRWRRTSGGSPVIDGEIVPPEDER